MKFFISAIATLVLCTQDAVCSITISPKNTLAVVNGTVRLECVVTGTPSNWSVVKVGESQRKEITTTDTTQRVYIDNSTTGSFDLVIKTVQTDDAGRYHCQEQNGDRKGSYLAVLVSPMVSTDHATDELVSGTVVNTTCSAGFVALDMYFRVAIVQGSESKVIFDLNSETTPKNVQVKQNFTASLPQLPEAKCEFYFSTAPNTTVNDIDISETNKYNLTSAAKTVSECAEVKDISPDEAVYPPGQVLTCVATGYPPPITYRWVDNSTGETISATEKLTLDSSLPLNEQITYQCVVNNTLTTVTCRENSIEHTFKIVAMSTTTGTTQPDGNQAAYGCEWKNIYFMPVVVMAIFKNFGCFWI